MVRLNVEGCDLGVQKALSHCALRGAPLSMELPSSEQTGRQLELTRAEGL